MSKKEIPVEMQAIINKFKLGPLILRENKEVEAEYEVIEEPKKLNPPQEEI